MVIIISNKYYLSLKTLKPRSDKYLKYYTKKNCKTNNSVLITKNFGY